MQFKKYWLSFIVWLTEIKRYLLIVFAKLKQYWLPKYLAQLAKLKQYLFKLSLLLIEIKGTLSRRSIQVKKYFLIKLFRHITKLKKYLFNRYLLKLIEIKESILKIFIVFKEYFLRKFFRRIAKIKRYVLKCYLRLIEIKEYLAGKLFVQLVKIKKYSIKFFGLLIEIKELLLKIFIWLINIRKYLLNGSVLALELCLLSIIFYMGIEFHSQIKITENIKTMQSGLANAILPLTNLLGKSTGNIDILEHVNQINVKPALYYSQQQKSHKLELILLNPNHNLIDCTGDIVSNVSYPIRINLIWQPMQQAADQYELICEQYNNKRASTKNRKVLLSNINAVRFKFLEYTDLHGLKVIDPKKLQQSNQNINDIRIEAVQIGMLVQSKDNLYHKVHHNWYSIFNERINFLDDFMHKVIYITIKSNLS